jgi:hypothetical protein
VTPQQLTTLGLDALDAGMAPVEFLMRDGALFSGPLTYVCDEYAILGGLGFPLQSIAWAQLVVPEHRAPAGARRPKLL